MAHIGAEATKPVTGVRRVVLAVLALVGLTLQWSGVGAAGASEQGELSTSAPAAAPHSTGEPTEPADAAPPAADVPTTSGPPDTEVPSPGAEVPAEPLPDTVVPPAVEVPPESVVPPPEEVVAPPAPAAILDVTPESSSSTAGTDHVLTAAVTDAAGNGVSGAAVDFELVAGPADDDVGTSGDTRLSPDFGCVTAGGGPGVAATCTVAYTESGNEEGTDRVVAWIDLDGSDATDESDPAEGRDSSCVNELDDPGDVPEPDGTDCVTQSWVPRAPAAIDVTFDLAANVPGVAQQIEAVVVDQDGEVLAGADTRTGVRFYFRQGSTHTPVQKTRIGQPDLACNTGTTGSCAVEYQGSSRGLDTICAVINGGGSDCSEPVDAPAADNKADVVEVAWVGGLLDIDEKTSSSLSGTEHVLTANVVDGAGALTAGVEIDFEVVAGPGDDDGDTPETPDLSCVTGTDGARPGSCQVSYTDVGNASGTDAVLAWVDADGSDATVEADRAEGALAQGKGGSGCAPGSAGIGSTAEPDDTDCATQTWLTRSPTLVDASPEAAGPGSDASAGGSGSGAPGEGSADGASFGAGAAGSPGEAGRSASDPGTGSVRDTVGSTPERFARELGQNAPIPFALLVAVSVFLWVQGRFDRKDPKLAVAALEEETLRFE
jgi:hypothetical protein